MKEIRFLKCAAIFALSFLVWLSADVYSHPLEASPNMASAGDWQNVRITDSIGGSVWPTIAWNGTNYGLTWADYRGGQQRPDIYFTLLDEDGNKIIQDLRLLYSPDIVSSSPRIVWNGTEFAVLWTEYTVGSIQPAVCALHLARISSSGMILGTTQIDGNCPFYGRIRLVWTGTSYGIFWDQGWPYIERPEVWFAKLDVLGNRISGPVRLTYSNPLVGDGTAALVDAFWDGSAFTVLWRTSQYGQPVHNYFARFDSDGQRIGPEIMPILSAQATEVTAWGMVWDGSMYGLFLQGYGLDGLRQQYFMQMTPDGNITNPGVQLTSNTSEPFLLLEPVMHFTCFGHGMPAYTGLALPSLLRSVQHFVC